MDTLDTLQKLGLSQHETKIYYTLLNIAPATVSDIYNETGIHRPTVYKELAGLVRKGLVSIIPKGKRKFFTPQSPEKLSTLIDKLETSLHGIIPELSELYKDIEKKPKVVFLTGNKGIATVFDDILNTLNKGDTWFRITSSTGKKQHNCLPPKYRERRKNKNLKRLIIASETYAKSKKPDLNREVRYVPDDYHFIHEVSLLIYKNKIAIVDYNSLTASIIENQIIANFQKNIFRMMWRILDKKTI